MIRTEFEYLEFDEKEDYLFRRGEIIGNRFYNDDIYLFCLEGFFVEVLIDKLESHFERIETINYEEIQSHYLHLIDISDAFDNPRYPL